MTKLEIVKQIARETGIEAVTVSAVVERFMEQVLSLIHISEPTRRS